MPTEAPQYIILSDYNAKLELKQNYNANKEIKLSGAIKTYRLVCITKKPHNRIRPATKAEKLAYAVNSIEGVPVPEEAPSAVLSALPWDSL